MRVRHLPSCEVAIANASNLSGCNQVIKSVKRFAHRGLGIKSVLLIQINIVGSQAAETIFDRTANPPTWRTALSVRFAHWHGELGCHHDIATAPTKRTTQKFFWFTTAIDISCIEKFNPNVKCGVDNGTSSRRVNTSAKVVTSEADNRHFEIRSTNHSPLHHSLLLNAYTGQPWIVWTSTDRFHHVQQHTIRSSTFGRGTLKPRSAEQHYIAHEAND